MPTSPFGNWPVELLIDLCGGSPCFTARAPSSKGTDGLGTPLNGTDKSTQIFDEQVVINRAELGYEFFEGGGDAVEIAPFMGWDEQLLTVDFPIFVPAHGRVRFGIHLKYPYKNAPPEPREGDETKKPACALHFAYYNFCRIRSSLRGSPAMEAGLTDHISNLSELVSAA